MIRPELASGIAGTVAGLALIAAPTPSFVQHAGSHLPMTARRALLSAHVDPAFVNPAPPPKRFRVDGGEAQGNCPPSGPAGQPVPADYLRTHTVAEYDRAKVAAACGWDVKGLLLPGYSAPGRVNPTECDWRGPEANADAEWLARAWLTVYLGAPNPDCRDAWVRALAPAATAEQQRYDEKETPPPLAHVTGPAVVTVSAGGLFTDRGSNPAADVPTDGPIPNWRVGLEQTPDGKWLVKSVLNTPPATNRIPA